MRSIFWVTVSTLVIALVFTYFSAEADEKPKSSMEEATPKVTTDRIIVKYRSDANETGRLSPAATERMRSMSEVAGIDLAYLREMSDEAHILIMDEHLPVSEVEMITQQLESQPDVEYAEPDYILMPVMDPDDPYYGNQWDYFDIYGINLPLAWDITTGSPKVKIAVIDTGITNHEDLVGRWLEGYDFIIDTTMSNDGDGRDPDPHDPGDWITSSEASSGPLAGCLIDDSSWHGTHVAGTIGAAGNNGIGIAGINWNSLIIPVRVLGKCGGYMSDVADGIRWAAGLAVSEVPTNPNPAKVLNLSLGGGGSCGITLQNAISAARTAGAVIVAAAGNTGIDASNFQPANCNGVITVAATTSSGNKASYSNYGTTVEISAPGSSILSTLNTGTTSPASDTYTYYSGTSMAAPHVAGLVSLLLSIDPTLTPDEILQILQNTATPFPTGSSCTNSICGSGIINANNAVSFVASSLQYPDLIITDVVIDPPMPATDQPFDVVITIMNQGAVTGPVTIYRDVYIDLDPASTIDPLTGCPAPGNYYRSDEFVTLKIGQTDTKTVTITDGLGFGSHQIWVYVDSRCLVQEVGEENNGQ